jgi:hypothetical protein
MLAAGVAEMGAQAPIQSDVAVSPECRMEADCSEIPVRKRGPKRTI